MYTNKIDYDEDLTKICLSDAPKPFSNNLKAYVTVYNPAAYVDKINCNRDLITAQVPQPNETHTEIKS